MDAVFSITFSVIRLSATFIDTSVVGIIISHLGKAARLIAIETPKIIPVVPWRMRNILAVPISIHLIPSATRNAAIFHV